MTHENGGSEWRDASLTPSEIAERFLAAHRDELLATGVACDPRLQGEVADDFADRAAETLKTLSAQAEGTRCFAVFSPPREVDPQVDDYYGTLRQAHQEIAVQLSADAHPLVLTFFEVHSASSAPELFAVGDSGVSSPIIGGAEWNQRNHRWPTNMGDDFRVNPDPAVELATLWGLAWLGYGQAPDPAQYAWAGQERGSITRYLETHEPGGTDVVVATSVFGIGGVGLAWLIARRLRREKEGDRSEPTRIPQELAERLPTLLDVELDPVDPDAASTGAGLDAATELRELFDAYEVLSARIRSRLPAEPTRDAVVAVVPPVEAAALLVLHDDLDARARAWKRHVSAGEDPLPADRALFCAFNPFHGQASATATVRGASASVDVPACAACREAIGRDEAPDALRVLSAGRTRGYTDVGDGYARSMFNALGPLSEAVQEAPASEPVGDRARSAASAVVSFLAMPALLLVLAAVLGVCVSLVLAAGEPAQFLTEQDLAERAAEAGPTVFGYPVLNAVRGGLFGALFAVMAVGFGTIVLVGVRDADRDRADEEQQ